MAGQGSEYLEEIAICVAEVGFPPPQGPPQGSPWGLDIRPILRPRARTQLECPIRRNDEYGFELAHPDDWARSFEDPSYQPAPFSVSLTSAEILDARARGIPVTYLSTITIRVLAGRPHAVEEELTADDGAFITNRARVTLNGHAADVMTVGGHGANLEILTERRDRWYNLIVFGEVSLESLPPTTAGVLSTFRFLE